jgi:predicted dehydrogenase
MSDPLRIGIVGSKFAASFHMECYVRLGRDLAAVAGVFSETPENCAAFAQKFKITPFGSFEELIGAVDVVDICAPGYVHEEYAVKAARAGKHVIVEKPFTGYFGPADAGNDWRGDTFSKEAMLEGAMDSARRIVDAAQKNQVKLCYAENWVYAPSIQKEAEVLRATGGQILWIQGEESHSGSHSPAYGIWQKAGGGSLVGKGCHPLTAALYLKRVEGEARDGRPLRPVAVSARTHELTRNSAYRDDKRLRTDYRDVEDFCQVHVVFEDGFVADILSTEIVMGGVHNWLEVFANNHRMRCNINPTDACVLYNPEEKQLEDVYVVEKIGTKQGWSFPSPDEDWMTGYPQELVDFVNAIREDREPQSGAGLALDTVATMYAAYCSAEKRGAEVEIPD